MHALVPPVQCLHHFHYDENDELLHDDFRVYPYRHEDC
jgi:hypothetical protein